MIRVLVKIFLPPCLLAFSLSASPADSVFFTPVNSKEVIQKVDPVRAPALSLADINKQDVEPDYQNKVTLVHFWASWCLPCRKELPLIKNLQQDYQQHKKFNIVTIAADSYKNIEHYINTNELQLPVLIDQYGKAMHAFRVKTLPSSYLIDIQGNIRYQTTAAIDWSAIHVRDTIDMMLLEQNKI